jgi:hypothetical protein
MKPRILIIFVLAVVVANPSFSQVKFGLRGGMNFSKMTGSQEIKTADYKVTCPKYSSPGYHVGLMSHIQISGFFIQPEFLYSSIRNDLDVYDLNSSTPDEATSAKQHLSRFDIPVMLGWKLGILKLEAGPIASFVIGQNSDLAEITQYKMKWNAATIGYQAGIGLDVGKMALDFKYEGNLSKLGTGVDLGSTTASFDTRMNQFIISLGLLF